MASAALHASAVARHASRRTRTHTSPLSTTDSSSPSPSSAASRSTSSWRAVSTDVSSGASTSVVGVSADDNRLTSPTLRHVLVADALLQQHDALEQRLGPRWAAGHVHVDRDQLVDALGDRVAVPVRATAVGAAAHRDHVLR